MKEPSDPARGAEELFARFLEQYEGRAGAARMDRAAFLAAHPEHAERLRAFLADLGEESVGPVLRPISRIAPGIPAPGSTAGSHAAAPSVEHTHSILERLAARGPSSVRYEMRDELAHGGQGRVLRVWDEELGRLLAMKVTHDSRSEAAAKPNASRSIGRFLEEARLTAQLDHPGIVPVHDFGVDEEGRVFFTMKLVKGRDLKEIFRLVANGEDGWTELRALSVLLRVCEGMAYAHAKGVIHRDLKPANVMVGRFGEVYVMDWGLARVLDQPDTKDIRIQQPLLTTQVQSLRHASASSEADASLITMDGDVVGTPAYMSPEQAAGNLDAMGPHSDVYSAGAMLYHLFAGHPPYLPPGTRLNNYAIWSRVQEGPPAPLHQRAPSVPAELIAITEKAMARDPILRYHDMSELGEDLRAFLEHRVVHAYETGAVAELRKWIVRNRALAAALAAALVTAIGGLGTTSYVQAKERAEADEQRNRAVASEQLANAKSEEAQRMARLAEERGDNVLRLSAFQNLEELQQRAETLWPASPELVDDYEQWLREANALVAGLHDDPATGTPGYYTLLEELRRRAEPQTGAELEGALAKHPRRKELERLRARTAAFRRALEVRAGRTEPGERQPTEELPDRAMQLVEQAWTLTGPDRSEFGREEEGLSLARLAFDRAENDTALLRAEKTLSWALFACGLDEEALAVAREAATSAEPALECDYRANQERLEQEIRLRRTKGAAELVTLEHRCLRLEWELAGRRFAVDEDRWWYAQLVKLVEEIEAFADPRSGLIEGLGPRFGWGIQRRLDFALSVEERTRSGSEARAFWAEAVAAIADPLICPAYRGLQLQPQLGLLPCGRDPRSGLWEFVDLQTGSVPHRGGDGSLGFDASSGLVFVLIPPGAFVMGAQRRDSTGPNYDPLAEDSEGPPHEVELGPFFLSKYEMTQAQWERFAGSNPSFYTNLEEDSHQRSLLHPVEFVSWEDCRRVLQRLNLVLPSEARWEYAARGGTRTPWWTGATTAELEGAANVLDSAAARAGVNVQDSAELTLNDGFDRSAPVNALRANRFGLHGVAGNVNEWCADGYQWDAYLRSERREPLNEHQEKNWRVVRGGSLDMHPRMARSSCRLFGIQDFAVSSIGVRPARMLTE